MHYPTSTWLLCAAGDRCYPFENVPAAYDLADVRGRAERGRAGNDIGVKWNRIRTISCVTDSLDMTIREAKAFMYDGLLDLGDDHYCHTLTELPPPADVYGIELRRLGWYVKFSIIPDTLNVISFHRPERLLQTRGMGLIR